MMGFPAAAAGAVRALDEHWDGSGRPDGLAGDAIPLISRIACLAQTAEVFMSADGPAGGARRRARAAGALVRPRDRRRVPGDRRRTTPSGCGSSSDAAAEVLRDLEPRDRARPRRRGGPRPGRRGVRPGHRRQVAVHGAPLDSGVAAYAVAIGRAARASTPMRAARPAPRRPAARHRQARRLEPDPRQAGQADRRRVRRGPAPPALHLPDPVAGSPPSPASPRPPRRTTSASTGAATTAGWAPSTCRPEARILAVADVFDALTADRPYRRPLDRGRRLRDPLEGRRGGLRPALHLGPRGLGDRGRLRRLIGMAGVM